MNGLVVVGMADCRFSGNPSDTLVTYALGSCIALIVHDPVTCVGGMLHFMLPDSSIDADKAKRNPWMFADTGIPRLLNSVCEMGGIQRRLAVYAVGGAQVMDEQGIFNIGKRNALAMRKLLWKAGVMLREEDLGGNLSRSVRLEIATGKCLLRTAGIPERTLCAAAGTCAQGRR
ncbi:MAG TPA: chemotaxis protein CheD [Bryobacteraceae bacterium]|nr:chemotaxis protein CheD [Bryobacteraceae bacterium]